MKRTVQHPKVPPATEATPTVPSVSARWVRAPWIILTAAAALAGLFCCGQRWTNCDEFEHLHAAWLWSQGVQPYSGFFEHHTPVYWYILRPLVADSPTDLVALIVRGRLMTWVFAVLSAPVCYWLYRRLFDPSVALIGMALWAWYCATCPTILQIRPDLLMVLLLACGTALAVEGVGLRGPRPSAIRSLAAGAALGAAVCVLTKGAIWVTLLVGVLLLTALWQRQRKGLRRWRCGASFWRGWPFPQPPSSSGYTARVEWLSSGSATSRPTGDWPDAC